MEKKVLENLFQKVNELGNDEKDIRDEGRKKYMFASYTVDICTGCRSKSHEISSLLILLASECYSRKICKSILVENSSPYFTFE